MLQAALNHRPDVLVVGELYTQQAVAAAVHITCSCNVLLVAGVTASSLSMVLQDSTLCQLLGFELCPTLGALMPNPNPCEAVSLGCLYYTSEVVSRLVTLVT
jgi:hypothetical protein